MRRLITYNDPTGPLFISDSALTPSSAVERDANNAVNVGQVNATALNPSNALYLAKSATLTATGTLDALTTVKRMDATSGNQIQTLPASAGVAGLLLFLKRVDASANTCTISGSGGTELIDNATTLAIGARGHAVLYANGTGWDIVA